MRHLAFFPWIELENDIDVGGYSLRRFTPGSLPRVDEGLRAVLDAVLAPYRDTENNPVQSAAILSCNGRSLTDGLSEGDRDDLFRFAELFAFAALAAREFFTSHYFNRDHLRLVIQAFTDPQGGAVVEARRRDGRTRSIIPGESYRVQMPAHVTHPGSPLEPDMALLRALLESREQKDWSRLYRGIVLFNQGNTDAPHVPPETEMVLTYAAIEEILGLYRRKDQRRFPAKFADAWCPSRDVPASGWRRQQPGGACSEESLRESWASDFKISRGSLAHAQRAGGQDSRSWTVREHLLVTSFAVPRLVKQVLSGLDLYELTEQDTRDIDAFESLLNLQDLFGPPCSTREERHSTGEFAWQQVLPSCRSLEYVLEQLSQV